MKNSDAIEKIINFLKDQSIEDVYRLCANCMLDLNRWSNQDDLEKEEFQSLIMRTQNNSEELTNFIFDKSIGKLTLEKK